VASITPSAKKLTAFRKISLSPGEEQQVSFELRHSDFSFVDKELNRITEPGRFQQMVADQKATFHAR
ncbi:MAG: fibronectin type III-like domain-contianing protein, partial [Bacteroidota bacterium]